MSKKNISFTLILLTAFVGTSILALYTAKKVTTTPIHSSSTSNPDFFMTNAIYTKFNREGNVQNQIITEKITHFAANNLYLFEKPNMTFYNPNEKPWHITANKGKSENGKSKVYLWDKVKITRTSGINNPDFDIATSQMTIYPDIKFAETDQPITIVQSGNITKAVGAAADFKTGIIKLISKIQGLFLIN